MVFLTTYQDAWIAGSWTSVLGNKEFKLLIKLDADKILPFLTKCVPTFHRSLLVILKLSVKKSYFPTSKI